MSNVREEAGEMVRCLGRRTGRPLWVRQKAALENVVYFDCGGTPFTLGAILRSRQAAYLEYQLFPKGQAPIYLLSPYWDGDRATEGFHLKDEEAMQLALRCAALEKRAGKVLMICAGDLRPSRRYTNLLSNIKMALGADVAVERGFCAFQEPTTLEEYRLILADAFLSEAALCLLLNHISCCPKILHIGCKNGSVYTLFEEARSVCFLPSKRTLPSAAFCFYAWLQDRGETGAANRLRCAIEGLSEESTSFADITALIKEPCRHRTAAGG